MTPWLIWQQLQEIAKKLRKLTLVNKHICQTLKHLPQATMYFSANQLLGKMKAIKLKSMPITGIMLQQSNMERILMFFQPEKWVWYILQNAKQLVQPRSWQVIQQYRNHSRHLLKLVVQVLIMALKENLQQVLLTVNLHHKLKVVREVKLKQLLNVPCIMPLTLLFHLVQVSKLIFSLEEWVPHLQFHKWINSLICLVHMLSVRLKWELVMLLLQLLINKNKLIWKHKEWILHLVLKLVTFYIQLTLKVAPVQIKKKQQKNHQKPLILINTLLVHSFQIKEKLSKKDFKHGWQTVIKLKSHQFL